MAEFEYANKTICEACSKIIDKDVTVFTVVNLDNRGSIADKLINEQLNLITCPHCGKTFIYELPFVAYSFNSGYSIFALPSYDKNSLISGKSRLFELFGINMTKFRLVNYLCELVEKIRIFESGLSDYIIEDIKLNNFDKKYFEDKRENILLFKEINDNMLVFEYRDYLGNVLEVLKLPASVYTDEHKYKDIPYTETDKINWQMVDINLIKELNDAQKN